MTPTEVRLDLHHGGYVPLPLTGKIPAFRDWQKQTDVTEHEIAFWSRSYPAAENTGILTKFTPVLDIDIFSDEEAATAVAALARERFEEHGHVLVRAGNWPKRAIPFRTDNPFAKISINLVSPGGTDEKLEFLCDGQQVVVHGVHPDTHRPYDWNGYAPGKIPRSELPYIHQTEAQALIDDAAALLVRDFGYRLKAKPRLKDRAGQGNGAAPWGGYLGNLADHDALAGYAMALLRSGMNDGAAVNFLRTQVEALNPDDDEAQKRQARRLKEIPDMVESAREKLEAETAPPPPPPATTELDQVIAAFKKWLKLEDANPVYAVLGTVAANRLDGEPVWTGLVAPPSSAKTEILNALSGLPDVEAVGVLTMAGLLSGTPKHAKAAGAKGGLLRKLGTFGILVLKDFGSVLSLRHEARSELLGALREIYDGHWTRHVGSDGGLALSWKGKIGLVFCATQAFDDERAFIASLGDRFLVCRLAPPPGGQLKKAMEHRGAALKAMREELANAVAGLFVSIKGREPKPITDKEIDRLERVVDLAVRLRGHVQRDRHTREIDSIHDPEGPSRLGLGLERLLAGLDVIGLDRAKALDLVETVALDSCPPIRRLAFRLLDDTQQTTRLLAEAMRLPTTTARRVLEDLSAQRLAVRIRGKDAEGDEKKSGADLWTRPVGYDGFSEPDKPAS